MGRDKEAEGIGFHEIPMSSPIYAEVTRRDRGHIDVIVAGEPTCFAEETQFEEGTESGAQGFIRTPRDCKSFVPYTLGHTPKEHSMIQHRKWLEDRADARDDIQRKWQQGESRASRDERKFNKRTRIAELILISAAVIAAAVAIVVSLVNDTAANTDTNNSSSEALQQTEILRSELESFRSELEPLRSEFESEEFRSRWGLD